MPWQVEVICETRESWWEALLLWLRNLGGSRGICDLLQRLLDITHHLIHLVNCNLSSNPDPACKSSLLANLLSWLNKQDQTNFDQMNSLSMALLVVLVIFLHISLSFVVVALVNPLAYNYISRVYNTKGEKVVAKSRRTRSRSSRGTRSSSSRETRSSSSRETRSRSSRRTSRSSTRGTSSKTSRRAHSSIKLSSSVSKSMRTTSTAVFDFFKGFLTHVYDFFSSIVTFVYDIISGLFSTKEEKVVTKSRRTRSRSSRKARSSSSRRTSRSSTRRTSSKTHSSTKSSSSVSDGKQVKTVVFDFFSGLVTSVYNFFKSLFTFVFDFILGLFNTKEERVVTRTRRTKHSSTKSLHQLADEEPVKVVIKEEINKRPAASKKKSKSKESSNVYELDIFDEAQVSSQLFLHLFGTETNFSQVVGSGNLDLISTSARPHLEGGPRGGEIIPILAAEIILIENRLR